MQESLAKATETTQIKIRPLVTFAMSSQSISNGLEYFSALVPLFTPIAISKHGEIFEAKAFCKEVEATYGLRMHPKVAESFMAPMEANGLIEKTIENKHLRCLRYAKKAVPSEIYEQYAKFESYLEEIYKEYHAFLKSTEELTHSAYNKEQLESGLIAWIVGSNKQFAISDEYTTRPRNEVEYIASRFLQHIQDKKPDLFDRVSMIYTGALVSELLLDYKAPTSANSKATDLMIFLDAPFVMHLLKLHGKVTYEETQIMYSQLQKIGAKLYIFDHSCDEIRESIYGVLSNKFPSGPLANAIRSREVMESYAQSVRTNLEDKLKSIGIEVFSPSKYGTQAQRDRFFTSTHFDSFTSTLDGWKNDQARNRDALSISTIMKWRNGSTERDLLKSKYLFVTNNDTLSKKAKEFCIKEGLNKPEHAPPAISMRTLSALLFLTLGSEGEKITLSRRTLLANCAKAAMITPEMIDSFNNRMKELSPEHKDQIAFILSEPRARQLIVDASWSNPMLITTENIETVISKTKEMITKEATKKHKAELKIVQSEYKTLAEKNYSLEMQMDSIVQGATTRAFKIVIFLRRGITLLSAGIIMGAGLPDILSTENWNYSIRLVIAACALVVLTADIYTRFAKPDKVEEIFKKLKEWFLLQELKRVSLSYLRDSYIIDWTSGTCLKKSNETSIEHSPTLL